MISYVSVNSKLVTALKGILPIDSDGNHPVQHLNYTGDSLKYLVFRFSTRKSEVHGSGKNRIVGCYGYVDFISNTDESGKQGLIGPISIALVDAGFIVQNISDISFDGNNYHTEYEVYYPAQVSQ